MTMSATELALEEAAAARVNRSWTVFFTSLVILFVTVLLIMSGLLASVANNHQGHPILPPVVAAGQSVSGDVTLTNNGLLPVQVWLQPRNGGNLPAGLAASLRDVDTGAYLYQGPLRQSMGPFEVIQPGQSSRLRLTIQSTDSHGTAEIQINYTYYWQARPLLPWWWWIPVLLLLLAIVGYVYRRSRRPSAGRA
jgi:H+/Cl- antiporter ClcA